MPSANCQQTIKKEVADVVVDMLRSVMEPGGFGYKLQLGDDDEDGVFEDPRAAGGKTGTTNNAIAVWYAGITPQLSAAVWLGNPDDYNFTLDNITIGGTYWPVVSGSRIPGPIWRHFMNGALLGKPALNFTPPQNKWVRGTQGQGDGRRLGKMTYETGDLNDPLAGDPRYRAPRPDRAGGSGEENDRENRDRAGNQSRGEGRNGED